MVIGLRGVWSWAELLSILRYIFRIGRGGEGKGLGTFYGIRPSFWAMPPWCEHMPW